MAKQKTTSAPTSTSESIPAPAPPQIGGELNLPVLFAGLTFESTLAEIDARLPGCASYEVRFTPPRSRLGLRSFLIDGLRRALFVHTQHSITVDREAMVLIIKTILKPGEIELGDVTAFCNPLPPPF